MVFGKIALWGVPHIEKYYWLYLQSWAKAMQIRYQHCQNDFNIRNPIKTNSAKNHFDAIFFNFYQIFNPEIPFTYWCPHIRKLLELVNEGGQSYWYSFPVDGCFSHKPWTMKFMSIFLHWGFNQNVIYYTM